MTQFQPPQVHGIQPGDPLGTPPPAYQLPPWSAAAIAGFVLSLIGCVGITAPFGLIFGIIGTVTTSGGRRRGRGLAIAAIPISIVMGIVSLLIAAAMLVGLGFAALVAELAPALEADLDGMGRAVAALRAMGSDDFNSDVNDQELQSWLEEVGGKHGKLVEIVQFTPVPQTTSPGLTMLNLDAKFVNGRTNITLLLRIDGWKPKLDDIQVDGSSPRDQD